MNRRPLPSKDRILSLLDYNPETGVFSRKTDGAELGRIDREGYRRIVIDRKVYRAGRLAFKIINGRDPLDEIDHENGDRGDDRACNIREATRSQNNSNRSIPRNNTSGFKGVYRNSKGGGWRAEINRQYLGTFRTPEAAYSAYCEAAKQTFGEFARI